jgi:hypothetical protein
MAGQDPDDHDEQTSSSSPWYNRTPAVVGASVAGVAAIGILITAVTYVSGQFNEPVQAPLNFVEPSFSATATESSTPTTTATITSTSPPVTTDINGPSSTPSSSDTSSTNTSSTDTSSTDTSTPRRTARTRESDDDEPSTTRRGPRTNVTRTLYPQP